MTNGCFFVTCSNPGARFWTTGETSSATGCWRGLVTSVLKRRIQRQAHRSKLPNVNTLVLTADYLLTHYTIRVRGLGMTRLITVYQKDTTLSTIEARGPRAHFSTVEDARGRDLSVENLAPVLYVGLGFEEDFANHGAPKNDSGGHPDGCCQPGFGLKPSCAYRREVYQG